MKRASLLVFVVAAIGVGGCAYQMASERDRLEASGRYGDLEKHLEADGAPMSDMETRRLLPLCISYSKLKKYNKLFPCIEELKENIKKGDKFDIAGPKGFEIKSDITPVPDLLLAEAYLELGNYREAIAHARKADAPFPSANSLGYYSEFAVRKDALTLLALAHSFSGDRAEAERYCGELENLSLGGFVGIAVRAQERRKALAKVYMALGQYEKALDSLKAGMFGGLAALTDLVVGAGAEQQSIFTYLELPRQFMLGKCLLETGRLKEAKECHDTLLKIPQTRDNGEIYWMLLFDRGRIAEKEGNSGEAIEFFRQSIEVIEQQRATIHTEASKIGFIGNKQEVYARLVSVLFSTRQHALAFEYVERSKSRALVDLLAGRKDFLVKSGNVGQVQALMSILESAEAEGQTQGSIDDTAKSRGIALKSLHTLREQAPELASLVSVSGIPASEIQGLIPGDEALIEYFYDRETVYAFAVSRQELHAVKLDIPDLQEDIRLYRIALQDPRSSHHLEMSQDLYERLLKPVIELTDKKKLTVVPHGSMHYLPLSCLHDGKGHLVEHFSIRTLPSAGVMKYLGKRDRVKGAGLLAFGNPDLGDPRYELEYAQIEAAEIGKTIPDSKVLVSKAATETEFRRHSGEYRFIHLATHGRFDPRNPLQSALLLAGDSDHDGMVTAGELYSIRIDADLVTLSACETGLAGIGGGDEVVGLTRGFLYAGSGSVVASLWKVDDLATSSLMTAFYSAMSRVDKREALRIAQMETMARFPHPYYWASFFLTGNAD